MSVQRLRWWVSNEPALGVAVAVALLALLLGFGLGIDGRAAALVLALVVVGGGLLTRALVYGPRTVDDVLDAEVVLTPGSSSDPDLAAPAVVHLDDVVPGGATGTGGVHRG